MKFLDKLGQLSDAVANKLPFNNNPRARWGIVAFLVGLIICFFGRCSYADSLDFSAGREFVHGNGAAIGLYYYHTLSLPKLGDSVVQSFIGTNMVASNGLGDQSNWDWAAGIEANRGHLSMGIGASYFARTDSIIGQHADYTLRIKYDRWKYCPIRIVHYSDAGSSPINTGVNLLLCEWKLR